jgi:hypothetical protein
MAKALYSLYLILLLSGTTCLSSCVVFSGITGPVYATDTDFVLKRAYLYPPATSGTPGPPAVASTDTVFILSAGAKYRIVDVQAGTNYIKMTGSSKYNKVVSTATATGPSSSAVIYTRIIPLTKAERQALRTSGALPPAPAPSPASSYHLLLPANRNHELFAAEERDIKPYQRILTAQVAVGTMILPIKLRGPIDHQGTHYERQFSTDISIGPYIGYRFKVSGNDYKPFTTIGLFAGPTLVNYVSSTSQSGSPLPTSTAPDNMFAFTYGIGLVHEINGFQIGLVYGTDRVSGKRVTEWPYDGKGWFSLGIGYNFLNAR